mmetsp:Transcript_5769/g.9917  ORF Transcript_5769/g.9917 Transcript_5769/m.9917 type:complete len:121 (+) Transcript_5769:404-766(+)
MSAIRITLHQSLLSTRFMNRRTSLGPGARTEKTCNPRCGNLFKSQSNCFSRQLCFFFGFLCFLLGQFGEFLSSGHSVVTFVQCITGGFVLVLPDQFLFSLFCKPSQLAPPTFILQRFGRA